MRVVEPLERHLLIVWAVCWQEAAQGQKKSRLVRWKGILIGLRALYNNTENIIFIITTGNGKLTHFTLTNKWMYHSGQPTLNQKWSNVGVEEAMPVKKETPDSKI